MRAAALTTATPDARTLQGRAGADGAPPEDAFDAALADVAQQGLDAAGATAGGTIAAAVAAPALPGAGQGIAALLAKLAGGVTSASGDGQDAAGLKNGAVTTAGAGDAPSTTKTDKTSDDAETAPHVAADPLAAMAALLPGAVAAPAVVVGAKPVKPQPDPAKLLPAIGDASIAKAADARGSGIAASADAATTVEPGAGFTLVASSTHFAPVPPTATPAMPRAAAAANDVSTPATSVSIGDATGPAVSVTETSPHDAAPTAAAAAHNEPGASLPDGTLQSIATAVTSLAADVASAASDPSPSAATVATDPAPASVAPARSLTLQLTPGDLGSVTVRLHMTANGLDVDLAVDDRKTLASISHARDELASAIGDNGTRVESLVIRGADASSTSTAGSHDSARSQSEAGAGQGFPSGGSGGSPGGDAPGSRQRNPQAAGPRDPDRDRGGDGVFV